MLRGIGIKGCPPPVKSSHSKDFNHFSKGFTLSEVLITLGIIGIIAAMTLPTVINKAQNMILKNQYKKAYNTLFNAIKLVQAKNEAPIYCFYWTTSPYPATTCTNRNEYGTCNKWTLSDGSPLPSDYSGGMNECKVFREQLFKTLNVATYCQNKALEKGCITNKHKGVDKVKLENNPEISQDPNDGFSDKNIKEKWPAWVLADGTIILGYSYRVPIFTIDINGHKSPNKWGYDMFTFQLRGDKVNGITSLVPITYATEKGGKSGQQMFKEMLK